MSKKFGHRQIVHNVDLSVRRGEIVGLLGTNGAGKTTVFSIMIGLLSADTGRIFLEGKDISTLPIYRRARKGIGYLPQESSLFRRLSVENNIRLALQATSLDAAEKPQRIDALIEEFKLEKVRKALPGTLSGGEKRRAEIARAVAIDPSFLLLDEPFAGVDPLAVRDVRALAQYLAEKGMGVLITDHNVRETLRLIDRAVIIFEGRVLAEGTAEEILANDQARRHYLGDDFLL